MHYSAQVWSKDTVRWPDGSVRTGKLLVTLSYYPSEGNLYETRDGKRWPNSYRDEFTYLDITGRATLANYLARLAHYSAPKRGYVVIATME